MRLEWEVLTYPQCPRRPCQYPPIFSVVSFSFFSFFSFFFFTAAFPARDGTGGLSGGDSERLGGGGGGARFGEAEAAAGATFSPTSEGVSPFVL